MVSTSRKLVAAPALTMLRRLGMPQEPQITREQLVQGLAAVSHATYVRHLKEGNRPFPAGVNEHDPTQHDLDRAENTVSGLEQELPLYRSTLEWFESQADVCGTRASYRKLYDASRIKYPPPQGLEPADDMFLSIRQCGLPEAHVAIVPNGYVCGNGYRLPIAVLAPDGKLIWDVSKGHPRVEDHWIFGETDLPEPTLVSDTTGVLTIKPQWSGSYFHWMFEVLPRIHLFRGSALPIQKYLVNTLALPFQRQTLAALDIPGESIIEVDSPFCIKAQDLALTSHIRLVAPAWVCAFLRSEFLKDPACGRKRLYVSRRTASGRLVANEDEVREVLASFKFAEVLPEQLSVQEQAEAFASASVVVGPHGGGLTNIVFCKPQTKVVEFFAPTYCHAAYWMLANQCNLDYYYLVGRGERSEWSWPAEEAARDPIEVDPDRLVALLRMAGL